MRPARDLRDEFGAIDIYLFDQLLKGRLRPGMRVLDAGCGDGRNLIYFLRTGFEVSAVDAAEDAVRHVRRLADRLVPGLPPGRFRVEPVEALSFEPESFDAVVSSAVLHFARDLAHFERMVQAMWRVLAAGGLFFARLGSSIGIEDRLQPLGSGRYRLPDGTDRFLVDRQVLFSMSQRLGGRWVEPLKTVNVQDERAMSTWVLEK